VFWIKESYFHPPAQASLRNNHYEPDHFYSTHLLLHCLCVGELVGVFHG
jgi:hypothetical protein